MGDCLSVTASSWKVLNLRTPQVEGGDDTSNDPKAMTVTVKSDNSQLPDSSYTSMEWLNKAVGAWYMVAEHQIESLLKDVLEETLNNEAPDIIEKITLEELTFGTGTPEIKGMKCKVINSNSLTKGIQKKLVFDVVVAIDSPDFEFKLGVKVPLVTLKAAVQKLSFIGNLRITALLSDQVTLPGIQNICVTFTERPEVGFNVELLDVIDIDTFGVDKIIADIIEDVLTDLLVYPGRLYVDLSKVGERGGVEVVLMPRSTDQHPGVITTAVKVARIKPTSDTLKLQVGIEMGKEEKKETVELMMDEQTVAVNYLINDFDEDELKARIWESRLIFKDIQFGAVKVDLSDMEFSQPEVSKTFSNEEKNIKIDVNVKAYMLPLIAIKQKNSSVIDYASKFRGQICTEIADINSGVVYVHIHRATNVPKVDDNTESDAFVTVYSNEKEVLRTDDVKDSAEPVFDEWTEFLIHEFVGSKLTFKIDDNDVWPNRDDAIGAVSLDITKDYVRKVNECVKIPTSRKNAQGDVNLYVSIVFRPVKLA